jgi:hypothetical protein
MTMPSHGGSKAMWGSWEGAPDDFAYDKQFFSGQDCFVFLYPKLKEKLIPIPVVQMQVGESQQKTPIYGAWSYHWDAIAKGQVIVQGEFTIVYTYPNMIGRMLGRYDEPDYPRDTDGSVKPIIENKKSLEAANRKDLRNDIWGSNTLERGDKSWTRNTKNTKSKRTGRSRLRWSPRIRHGDLFRVQSVNELH